MEMYICAIFYDVAASNGLIDTTTLEVLKSTFSLTQIDSNLKV